VKEVTVDLLLAVAVVVQVLAGLGVALMRNGYARLHYAAAASTVGPVAIAAAAVFEESLSETGVKAVIVAIVVLVGGPLLTHATGRAAVVRERGGWKVHPHEVERPR
jgi:multicomponent Na+:H+ antiporter subunit G